MLQRPFISRLDALPGGAERVLRYALLATAGMLVWFSLLEVPTPAAGPQPDGSWGEAYSYFAKHGFQAGRDYIFTCGPLGHLRQPAYESGPYWFVYLWQFAFAAALTSIFLRFACRQPGWWRKVLFCGVVVVSPLLLGTPPDALLIGAIVLASVLAAESEGRSAYVDVGLLTLVAAAAALMSFILLVVGVAAVALLALRFLIDRRYRLALFLVVSFGAALLGAWCLAGQALGNLPAYLTTSLELTTGYTEAMAAAPRAWFVVGAVVALVLLALAWLPLDGGPWRETFRWQHFSLRRIPLAVLVVLALFVSWKHAFVRADFVHVVDLFVAVLLLLFLVPALSWSDHWGRRTRIQSWMACGMLSFLYLLMAVRGEGLLTTSAIGEHWRNRLQYVFAPAARRSELEEYRQRAGAQWSLPKIRARVGNEPVDMISYEQGVLFLNGLNWRPRPVFQSYSVYTPALLEVNAEFFRGERAPKFVIFKLQTIDGRLPALDDGLALQEILRRYEPVLAERYYLLLERRGATQQRQVGAEQSKVIHFGQQVPLDETAGDCQSVSLKLRLTWRGRLMRMLFQLPKLELQTRTADGQTGTYRLVSAMAERGFLLNPLLLENADVLECFGPRRGRRVVSLQVSGNAWGCYDDDIAMTVASYERPVKSHPLSPAGQELVLSSYADTQNQLGRAALANGQLSGAIGHFRESLRLKPEAAEPQLNLGIALQRQGKTEEAIKQLQAALRLNPNSAVAHGNLGLARQRQGKTAEAVEHYREALRLKPDDSEIHSQLGFALQALGQHDEAMVHNRRALRLNPNNAAAHYNLGKALKKQGSLDEAIKHYQEARRLRPDLAEVYNDLGVALHARGRVGEATANFRQALLLKPDFLEALNNLGLALQSLGRNNEAIAQFNAALRLKRDYPATYRNLGLALQTAGRDDEAVRQYRELIRLKPDHVEAYNNLAMILAASADAKLRDGKLAVEMAEKANQLSKGQDPGILDTLAAACAEAGDFDRAVREQTAAMALAPEAKRADYRARLKLYQAKRPLRQEPKK